MKLVRRDVTAPAQLLLYTNVNLCTEKGDSPLSIATQKGHKTIKQILLDNGANEN